VPDYREERSPLWGLAATGAFAGGTAYGLQGRWQELFRATQSANTRQYSAAEQAVGGMARFAESANATGLGLLRDFAGTEVAAADAPAFKRDVAISAYEAILKGKGQTGHEEAYSVFQEVVGASDATQAASVAQRELDRLGGDVGLFSKRVEQFFPGGAYEGLAKDMGEFSGMVLSDPKTEIPFTALSTQSRSVAEETQARLGRIFKDRSVAWSPSYHKVGEQEILSATISTPGRPTHLNIPLRSDVGETYAGPGFRNKYITRGAWEITPQGVRQKSISQLYLDTLETEASMAESSVGLARAVERAKTTVQEKTMVWSPSEEMLTTGDRLRQRITASQRAYVGKDISPATIRAGIEAGGLPLGSPAQVAKGVLTDVDWQKELLGPLGELMPAHRRPLQFIREGWQLSDIARTEQGGTYAREGALGELASRFSPAVAPGFEEATRGHVAPAASTFYLKPGATDYSKQLAEEMGIMSREAAALQKWERVSSQKLRVAEGMPLTNEIKQHMEKETLELGKPYLFDQPVPLEPGQGLGIGDKGQIAKIRRKRGVQQFLMGYEVLDAGRIKANIKEVVHMRDGDVQKFFSAGSDIKHTIKRADPQEFLRTLGVSTAPVDVVVPGERLTKTPYALFSQQISGMQEFAAKRIDAVRAKGIISDISGLEEYVKDPLRSLGLTEDFLGSKKIQKTGQLSSAIQNRIVLGAERLGLMRSKIAPEIFGMMDPADVDRMIDVAEDLSEEVVSVETKEKLMRAIGASKGVRGSSHMFLGDLIAEGGTGNMAKWEPSLFHWLTKGGPPGLGAKWATDIERRLVGQEGAEDTVREMTRMQKSLLGEGSFVERVKAGFLDEEDFLSLGKDDLVKAQGRWVNLGQSVDEFGGKRIFIPGHEAAPQLGSLKTDTGELVRSEFENALFDLQSSLKDQSENAERKILESARNLRAIGHAQWSGAVTMRERAYGTRMLAAQRLQMIDEAEDLADNVAKYTHKISSRTATDMFEEMQAAAPDETTRAFLSAQQEAFEQGERIPGLVGRYPAVGPYSVQPTFFQKADDALDEAVYSPDIDDEITIAGEGIRGTSKKVSVGQGVGQRLDYDLDRQIISFLSDQETSSKTSRYLSGQLAGDYEEFLGRHYGLQQLFEENKPAGVDVARGIQERLDSGAKHYIGQMGIGKTNVALEKFRRASALRGADFQAKYEPLLWHMEETATIMAKHGGAHAAEELYSKYGRATAAIERGRVDEGARLLQETIEALGGKESARLSVSFARTGREVAYDYDPSSMAQDLSSAYAETHDEIRPAMDISRQSKRAAVNLSEEEIKKQISLLESRVQVDAAQVIRAQRTMGSASIGARTQRAATVARSRYRAIGNVLKKGKGPMALGAAAAAGILLASPPVSGTIPANPNIEGAAGGRNINPEDSIPPSGPGMRPPRSGMRASPKAYLQKEGSTMANMRATSSDFGAERVSETLRQMRELESTRMRSRIKISDNRESLDSRMLADKIYRSM